MAEPRTPRTRSDDEIDISTPARANSLKAIFQWVLWFVIFLMLLTLGTVFEVDVYSLILYAFATAIVLVLGWIWWSVIVKRGALTWMRLARKPARLYARGDAEGADRACADALARARRFEPDDHRRGMMLCEIAQYVKNQGRYPEAIALYEESVDILSRSLAHQPMDYFVALNNYAICFIHLKDYEAAQGILEKVVDLSLATRKRGHGGISMQARQIESIEFVLHMNLAFLLIEMRELDEAQLHLEESDAILPTLPRGVRRAFQDHHCAIWTLWLYSAGQFAEAEAELAKASDPNYPACLRLRSRLLLVRQDFAGAEAALRQHQDGEKKKGTLHRPEFLEHILDLAECQYGQGQLDAAFGSLEEAHRLMRDFDLPRDAVWMRAVHTWLNRARQHGQHELAQALQAEIDSESKEPSSRAIKVLDKVRVRRE